MSTTTDSPADPDADARDALELSSGENADLCSGCVRCCSYLSIAIDPPRAAWEYDQWIWALHHEKVAIYVERPEQWFLHFETRCRQLDGHGRCSIHGRHPMVCREYDPRSCERRYPLSHLRAWFSRAEEFETWLERERPAHWTRLMAWRKDTVPTPEPGLGDAPRASAGSAAPTAAWIPLEALALGAAPNGRRTSAASGLRAKAPLPLRDKP